MADLIRLRPVTHTSNFAELYEEGQLCDLTLRAVGSYGCSQDFNVHRVIIAGASAYWKGLLASDWPLEAGKALVFVQAEPKTLAAVVRHIYGLEVCLDPESALHVVNAADLLLMESFKALLRRQIIRAHPSFKTHQTLFLRTGIAYNQNETEDPDEHGETSVKRHKPESAIGDDYNPLLVCDTGLARYFWDTAVRGLVLSDITTHLPALSVDFVRAVLAHNYFTKSKYEILLFRWAVRWANATKTPFGEIAEGIRYPLMTAKQLFEVEESGVVDPKPLLTAYRIREGGLKEKEGIHHGAPLWMTPRMNRRVSVKIPGDFFQKAIGTRVFSEFFQVSGEKLGLYFKTVSVENKVRVRVGVEWEKPAVYGTGKNEQKAQYLVSLACILPGKTDRVVLTTTRYKKWCTVVHGTFKTVTALSYGDPHPAEAVEAWMNKDRCVSMAVGIVVRQGGN